MTPPKRARMPGRCPVCNRMPQVYQGETTTNWTVICEHPRMPQGAVRWHMVMVIGKDKAEALRRWREYRLVPLKKGRKRG